MGAEVIGFQWPAPGSTSVEVLVASFGMVAMDDKTQLATIALGAKSAHVVRVAITTAA